MLSVDFMIQLMDRFGDGHLGRLASRLPIHGQAEEGYALVEAWCNLMSQGVQRKNNDEQSIPPGFQV